MHVYRYFDQADLAARLVPRAYTSAGRCFCEEKALGDRSRLDVRQDAKGDEPVEASSGATINERQGRSTLVFISTSLIWCSHRLETEENLDKKLYATPKANTNCRKSSSFIVKED